LQLQSGFNFSSVDTDDAQTSTMTQSNTLRMGLTEHFEVSTQWDVASINPNTEGVPNTNGISNAVVAARVNIREVDGWKPGIGLVASLGLTTVSEDFRADNIAPGLLLVATENLGERWGVYSIVSVGWNGNSPEPSWGYVEGISFTISDKLSTFAEAYGTIGAAGTLYDGGFAWLVSNNFQLVVSGGYAELDEVPQWFADGGLTWRIPKWRPKPRGVSIGN